MSPQEACCKARESGYTRELEILACKNTYYAYVFACWVTGASIKYCQEHACKNPRYAYCFARDVSEADIEYCQEHACKNPIWAYNFTFIPGADLNYCLESCQGTIHYAKIQVHIMEEAIG